MLLLADHTPSWGDDHARELELVGGRSDGVEPERPAVSVAVMVDVVRQDFDRHGAHIGPRVVAIIAASRFCEVTVCVRVVVVRRFIAVVVDVVVPDLGCRRVDRGVIVVTISACE